MKKVLLISMLSSSVFLTGCASIVNGTTQPISVSTAPTEHADCVLKNDKGIWYANNTPTSVSVHRAYGDLKVTCKKDGFATKSKSFKSHTKGMAFGNVIFGGVIGAGVDVGSGAAYDYPQSVVVPMSKTTETSNKIANK